MRLERSEVFMKAETLHQHTSRSLSSHTQNIIRLSFAESALLSQDFLGQHAKQYELRRLSDSRKCL
jgi:hypothetical protein